MDIWPPAYARMVGQDWQALAPLADWMKPIVYPMPAGPASMSGELVAALRGWQGLNPSIAMDALLEILYRVFGFAFDAPQTIEELSTMGFPAEVYELEMRRSRALVQKRRPLYAGCPIVDTDPEGVARRVEAVARTDADGIFYYCYDYATWDNLETSGKTWNKTRG